jgi:ABC-type antimicrobial peptide transport system permease subunit
MNSDVIYLKAFRDIWQMKWRALAIALILSFGVAAYVGIYASVDSLFHTRDTYYQELGSADLDVFFMPQRLQEVPDITGIHGVAEVEHRLVTMGNIQLGPARRLPAVLILLDGKSPSSISRLKVIEGRLPDPKDQEGVVVERSLALYHGYKVGDTIRVNVGKRAYEGKIRGVVVSSEFLTPTANPDYFVPQKGSLGVVYADLARVKEVMGEVVVDDLIVRYHEGADAAATRGEIVDRLDDALAILQVTSKEEQFGYQYLDKDLGAFKLFVPAIIAVFAMTSFLITLITFNRMILSQRKEIGTLLAIGYGPGKVFSTYLIGGLVIGIMGSIFSFPLSFMIRDLFGTDYARAIGLPEIIFVFSWSLVLKGTLMGLAIALLAAAWPAFRVVRMSPQEAIRAPQSAGWQVGRRFQQALIRKLPSSTYLGFGLRNLLRRKGLAASTVVCIALAVGVAISYVVSMSSVNFTVEQYFKRDQWSLAVDLLSPVSSERVSIVKDLVGIDLVVPTVRGGVQLFKGDRRLDCRLVGLPHDSPLNSLNLIAGRAFRDDGSLEVVLDKEDARDLGAQIGDLIRIIAGKQEVEVSLVGVVTGLMRGQAYGGLEMARRLLEMEERTNGLFLSLKPGVGEEKIVDRLYSLDYVGKVTSKGEVVGDFLALTHEIMGIVYVCSAFSILTGILFIFTGITLNILEREAEYATLQTLGFGRRHLVGIILSEVMAQATLALILSIPAAALISTFLTGRMSAAWFTVTNNFTLGAVLGTLVPALLVMPLATIPGLRSIFRINIAEAVRKTVMD